MPLQKTIAHDSQQVNITYWVHVTTTINHPAGDVWVVWNGFVDKAAFDAGKPSLAQRTVTIPNAAGNTPAAMLTYIENQSRNLAAAVSPLNGATVVA